MIRRVFVLATIAFWLTIAFFATSELWLARQVPQRPAEAVSGSRSLSEVARHRTADDCWMAIDGQVYDLSSYLPDHPSAPEVIIAWCGREASHAYHTKNRDRAHSPRADRLLAEYRIAALQTP